MEDRDRAINARLDSLERQNAELSTTVIALKEKVNVVQLEQNHLKDLIDARLRIIEKGQEMQMTQTQQIAKDISTMAGDADKTPAGRQLLNLMATMASNIDIHTTSLQNHGDAHSEFKQWKDHIDGVIGVLKWVGAGGLVGLGITLIRLAMKM